jgi:hypothetical protein
MDAPDRDGALCECGISHAQRFGTRRGQNTSFDLPLIDDLSADLETHRFEFTRTGKVGQLRTRPAYAPDICAAGGIGKWTLGLPLQFTSVP